MSKNQNQAVSVQVTTTINELYQKTSVLQTMKNTSSSPLELKITVSKKDEILFDSFQAKIGTNKSVSSKVIEKTKGQEKFSDEIASGNAAIFVEQDKYDNDKFTVHLGNIPPNETVEFTSNFINYVQVNNDKYECELLRFLPVFYNKDAGDVCLNKSLNARVIIKSNSKITEFKQEINSPGIKVTEDKHINANEYSFKFTIKDLKEVKKSNNWLYSLFSNEPKEYIQVSKISFKTENIGKTILIQQKHPKLNEKIYNFQSIFNKKQEKNTVPSCFIFLIDQSGSMSGSPIKIVQEALKFFLQSLPINSYYQMIGFGSHFKKYHQQPVLYTNENVNETFDLIETLNGNMGGTNIYDPLENIFSLKNDYNKIDLPKTVILLTDGEINDRQKTLDLIENNSNYFSVHAVGIGNDFDETLIKNAGLLGKGSFNFVKETNGLVEVIVDIVEKCCINFASNIKIDGLNEGKSLVKDSLPNTIVYGKNMNYSFITADDFNLDGNSKVKINYVEHSEENKKENKSEVYDFKTINYVLPPGEELFKLFMNKKLRAKSDENLKNALKYQVLTEDTCLFAKIDLEEKVSEDAKKVELTDKTDNTMKELTRVEHKTPIYDEDMDDCIEEGAMDYDCIEVAKDLKCCNAMMVDECYMDGVGMSCPMKMCCEKENCSDDDDAIGKGVVEEKVVKYTFIDAVRSQNFIEGSWDDNEKTKDIKDKYINEYNLVFSAYKNVKVAVTLVIMLCIKKEHKDKIKEYLMILKKADNFLKKNTGKVYDEIIKDLNIKE